MRLCVGSYGQYYIMFPHAGYYNLTLQSKHTTGAHGMAFKFTEDYVCPDSCSECINRQCCPVNFTMTTTGNCTCSNNNYGLCQCLADFWPAEVSISPSVFSCVMDTGGELRTSEMKSRAGLYINCSISGNGTTITYGNSGNAAGAPWIYPQHYMPGDNCNISFQIIKHSDLAIFRASFLVNFGTTEKLFVDGKLCRSGESLGIDITNCFQQTGFYDLTVQGDLASATDAFAFKFSEIYYCLPDCADCINDKCCPSNYVIEDQDCGCEESSLSSCSCPFGYVLHRHHDSQSSLYQCHLIDSLEDQSNSNENLKENTVISKSGLDISCPITGLSSTAISTVHSSKNNIAGTDWVWTYNGPVDNDNCNVNIFFFKHSLSNITLQFDGEDDQSFFVNSVLCWSGGRGPNQYISFRVFRP